MFDQINTCEYIFLDLLTEPNENSLRVVIEEARASGPVTTLDFGGDHKIQGVRAIETTYVCASFEIVWPTYIAYAVRNESYVSMDETEKWNGRLFCIYTKSHFLDFVHKSTFAREDFLGPMRHWGIKCLNHIIDVISVEEPKIFQQTKSAILCK